MQVRYEQTAPGVPQDTVFVRFAETMPWLAVGYLGHSASAAFITLLDWAAIDAEDQQLVIEKVFAEKGTRRVWVTQPDPEQKETDTQLSEDDTSW